MQCGQRYAGLPLRLYTDHWSVALQNFCIQTIGLLQTVCMQTILHLWSVLGPYVHCTSSQVLNGFKRSAMQQQTCTGPSNSAIVTSDSFVLGIFDSVSDCFYVYF